MAGELAPEAGHDLLGQLDHVVLGHERHLDVELGELRLAVGAEVLVPVAAGDLVVALHPGHHEQLLEQLRRLRQGVPGARLQPDRHQEVAGTLRSGAGERRRLDLVEVACVQHLAGDLVGPRAQLEGVRRAGSPQVEVAVLEPDVVAGIDVVVYRQRQRSRLGEHLQRRHDDLDVAGRQLRVLVPGRATLHLAGHLYAVLVAQRVRLLLLAEHDLDDSGGVAEVDEGHPAVVAAAGHPSGEGHRRYRRLRRAGFRRYGYGSQRHSRSPHARP